MKIGVPKKVDRPAAREIAPVRFRALGEVIFDGFWSIFDKFLKKSIFKKWFPI